MTVRSKPRFVVLEGNPCGPIWSFDADDREAAEAKVREFIPLPFETMRVMEETKVPSELRTNRSWKP